MLEIKKTSAAIAESHRRFHETVHTAKALVLSGRTEEARVFIENQVRSAREETFEHMNAIEAMADEAVSTMKSLQEQLLAVVLEKQRPCISLLEKVPWGMRCQQSSRAIPRGSDLRNSVPERVLFSFEATDR